MIFFLKIMFFSFFFVHFFIGYTYAFDVKKEKELLTQECIVFLGKSVNPPSKKTLNYICNNFHKDKLLQMYFINRTIGVRDCEKEKYIKEEELNIYKSIFVKDKLSEWAKCQNNYIANSIKKINGGGNVSKNNFLPNF